MKRHRKFWGPFLVVLSISSLWVLVLITHLMESRKREGQAFWPDRGSNRAFVFFGYMGCGSSCPPMFTELSRVAKDRDISVILVMVQPQGLPFSDIEIQKFVRQLHPNIQVVTATTKEVEDLWLPSFFEAMPYSNRDWIHGSKAFYLEKDGGRWQVKKQVLPKQVWPEYKETST